MSFLGRCEYIERKTPSKNILEFTKHFSSRSHIKLFLDHPVYNALEGEGEPGSNSFNIILDGLY